jgi:hypothetical protein
MARALNSCVRQVTPRNFAQIVSSTSRVPLVLCCYAEYGQAQKNARLRDLTPLLAHSGDQHSESLIGKLRSVVAKVTSVPAVGRREI